MENANKIATDPRIGSVANLTGILIGRKREWRDRDLATRLLSTAEYSAEIHGIAPQINKTISLALNNLDPFGFFPSVKTEGKNEVKRNGAEAIPASWSNSS